MRIDEVTSQELSFRNYTNRQLEEITPERLRERAAMVRPSGNFFYNGHKWSPSEYKGFAVVSMVEEQPGNELLPFQLSALQDELRKHLQPSAAYYMLPPSSFHQTVANTASAQRFHSLIVEPGLEEVYPTIIKEAFNRIPADGIPATPIRMKLAGLSIFGTSLGLLGVFEKEEDFQRIIRFRSGFYGDRVLSGIGIRRTRPFIGHITLAYVEQDLDTTQREHLAAVISTMNESIRQKNYCFSLSGTGLRRYDHLAEFRREDTYPAHLL